jgi:phytanoyl-CoA hydroxylase
MQYIDIRGTSQENIAKEVEEIAKRRGMELEFQVNSFNIISIVGGF